MPFIVPIAMLCVAMSIPYAFTATRNPRLSKTIVCVIFPVFFAMFSWSIWQDWHAANNTGALQYLLVFVCVCLTFAITLVALGRRVQWLRHHHHSR